MTGPYWKTRTLFNCKGFSRCSSEYAQFRKIWSWVWCFRMPASLNASFCSPDWKMVVWFFLNSWIKWSPTIWRYRVHVRIYSLAVIGFVYGKTSLSIHCCITLRMENPFASFFVSSYLKNSIGSPVSWQTRSSSGTSRIISSQGRPSGISKRDSFIPLRDSVRLQW